MTQVLRTDRLTLRHFTEADAEFILRLVNEPSWIRFIGDRNVHTVDDAVAYLRERWMPAYERHGYGLYLAERLEDGVPLGMCGLVRRDTLEHADVGFAFLPEFWGQGYATESAAATLDHARDLGMGRLLAITHPDNVASIRLLERIGFRLEGLTRLGEESDDVRLFAIDL
jgi:ribosomal-protein-alanine N-acetyltransferase